MKHLIVGLILLSPVAAIAESIFDGAPAVPPGYEDYKAAQKAVVSGEVTAVKVKREVPESISFFDDVVYATHDGTELSLDIFVPKEAKTAQPLLLFIHGGGWRGGKKEDYFYYNVKMTDLGYTTASVQYRLSPDNHFPAAVQDVKCAISFLRENAEAYNIDPKTIIVLGGSAGGHLSLMAGYADHPSLDCPDDHHDADTQVQGVVNLYGVTDCTTEIAINASQVKGFIGEKYENAKEAYELASPILQLDKNDPPTLTFHGTIDELVPIAQADRLHKKLDELGIANYYDRVDGWPHSMDVVQPINDRCRYVIERFLEIHAPLNE